MTTIATGQLSADVTVDRPEFRTTASIDVAAGGRLAVLGPNGSGKSTLLGAIAGLVPLSHGSTVLDDRLLERAGQVRMRPAERRIGLLDQKPRLFPHLSVWQNIAFGPLAGGAGRTAARAVARTWLERLELADRADAAPHELSGGQQQRVAIARAFAAEPRLLLLDEPFAALDAESAPSVRRLLSEELARTRTAAVLVTHDLADAWQLADDCLVLHDGRVVERGSPAELASAPRHPFTARLAGFAVVEGCWTGTALDIGDGILLPGRTDGDPATGAAAFAVIAPQEVRLLTPDDLSRAGVTAQLASVSSQAGSLRLEHRSGLAAVVPVSAFHGRPLPRVGDIERFELAAVTVRRAASV
ncbi:sulfate/molybdate ABC transporter ATP-binding protein [Microbacterium sp. NPDC056234]|uniref:sulfate/molybdate ABC transporter ATP-binding protein n=1 Tax=Microbacterium sp. NPDC056234 TaxID=3345757 RepID=UPI0035D7533A